MLICEGGREDSGVVAMEDGREVSETEVVIEEVVVEGVGEGWSGKGIEDGCWF